MRHKAIILAAVSLATLGASFFATVLAKPRRAATTTAPSGPAVLSWLNVSTQQRSEIEKDDRAFPAESATLMRALKEQRQALAALLRAENASDAEILAQVDRVGSAERDLQKRVTQYVLRVRHHLTPEQQVKLMGLCANGVQGGGRCKWCATATTCRCAPEGGAGTPDTGGGTGRGPGPHRGPPGK